MHFRAEMGAGSRQIQPRDPAAIQPLAQHIAKMAVTCAELDDAGSSGFPALKNLPGNPTCSSEKEIHPQQISPALDGIRVAGIERVENFGGHNPIG